MAGFRSDCMQALGPGQTRVVHGKLDWWGEMRSTLTCPVLLVDSICVKVFVMNAPILRSAPPPATDRLACIGRVRQWGSQFRGNGYNQDADQDRQPFDSFSHNASSGLGVLDVFFFFLISLRCVVHPCCNSVRPIALVQTVAVAGAQVRTSLS